MRPMPDSATPASDDDYLTAVEAAEELHDLLLDPTPDWEKVAELASIIRRIAEKHAEALVRRGT